MDDKNRQPLAATRLHSISHRLRCLKISALAIALALPVQSLIAAPQGLPFNDNFSDDSSIDPGNTTALRSAMKQAMQLQARSAWNQPLRNRAFLPEPNEPNSTPINTEVSLTATGALGDVNHDGHLDGVFVQRQSGGSNFVNRVCIGDGTGLMDGNGSFCTTYDGFTPASGSPRVVRLVDVNHDGHLDIVEGRSADVNAGVGYQTNRLNLGNGDGTFAVGTDIGSETDDTRDLQVVDVNRDGHPDVLVANFGSHNRLYLGDGMGGFGTPANIGSETENTRSLETGDFDRDGDVDIIANNRSVKRIYFGDGSGAFSTTGTDLGHDTDNTEDMALADFTSDGIDDLLLVNVGALNKLYPGNGSGGFSNPGLVTGLGSGGSRIGVADFDFDGHLDVVIVDHNINRMFFGDGNGAFVVRGATSSFDRELNDTVDALIGDIDNDGSPDVLLPQSAAPTSPWNGRPNHVYLNSPGTGFDPQGLDLLPNFEVKTTSIKLADLDGDGDLDAVVGSYASDSDAVYLNIFDGAFNTSFVQGDASLFEGPYPIANSNANTTALDLGDANGDRHLDLVTGDIFSNVKLYLGDGGGGFGIPVLLQDLTANDIIFADVEPDGDLDILVAAGNSGSKLFLNDGSGGFPLLGTSVGAASDKARSVAVGDVNGDGLPDLVVGNYQQTNKLYLGDGVGSFNVVGTSIGSSSYKTQTITLQDFDGDGHLDVITGNRDQSDRIYLNDGNGNFPVAGTSLGGGNNTYWMLVDDVNNDAIADVVAIYANGSTLFLGDGSGGVAAGSVFGLGSHSAGNAGALGDLDRDGDLDLVKGINNDVDQVYFNEFDNGSFDDYQAEAVGSDAHPSQAGLLLDANGDHWPDLAVANAGVENRLYLGMAGGNFSGAGTIVGLETDQTMAMAQADFNHDGHRDLVVANLAAQNRIYFGDGSGGFDAVGTPVGSEADDSRAIAVADLDQDGNPDILVGNDGQANRYYLGDGLGGFSASGNDIGTDTDATWAIAVIDVDHDGQADLISANLGQNRLYTGDGSGAFNAGVAIGSEADDTRGLAVADLNGDGNPDLVVGNSFGANYYYLGDGAGNFSANGFELGPEAEASYGIAVTDIGNDGDYDIVVANLNQPDRLYLNNGYLDFGSLAFGTGADELASRGVVAGDTDRDGDQDLLLLKDGQLNRQLMQTGYQAHRNRIVSNKVNGIETGITELRLTATVHGEHRNRYYLSNDGGLSWHTVQSGVDFTFPAAGDDIRWKAEIVGANRVLPPSLLSVEITNDEFSSPTEAISTTKSVLKSLKKIEKKKSVKNHNKSKKFAKKARKHLLSALKLFEDADIIGGREQVDKAIADLKKVRKEKKKIKRLIKQLKSIS